MSISTNGIVRFASESKVIDDDDDDDDVLTTRKKKILQFIHIYVYICECIRVVHHVDSLRCVVLYLFFESALKAYTIPQLLGAIMSIRSPASSSFSGPSSNGYFRPSHPRASVPSWGSIPLDLRVPSRDELSAAMDDDMGPHTAQCGIDDDDTIDGSRASCVTPKNASDVSGHIANGRKQVRIFSHTHTQTEHGGVSRYRLHSCVCTYIHRSSCLCNVNYAALSFP